ARELVAALVDALPSGSYLAITDADNTHPPFVESMRAYAESGAVPYHLRSPEQIRGFFDGLELVEPGVVAPYTWRPDRERDINPPEPLPGTGLAGVARKPCPAAGLRSPARPTAASRPPGPPRPAPRPRPRAPAVSSCVAVSSQAGAWARRARVRGPRAGRR